LTGIQSQEEAKRFFFSSKRENGDLIINGIAEELVALQDASLTNSTQPVNAQFVISSTEYLHNIQVDLTFDWDFYSSNMEANIVDGYYNFGDSELKGEIIFPMIDRGNPNIGPEWSKCERPTAKNLILINLLSDTEGYVNLLTELRDKL
jgi:hypothetical protein